MVPEKKKKKMEQYRVQVKIFKCLWNLIYDKDGFSGDKMTCHLGNVKLGTH